MIIVLNEFQIAQHQGFIHINWTRVNRGIDRAARRLEEETSRNLPYLQRNVSRRSRTMLLNGAF